MPRMPHGRAEQAATGAWLPQGEPSCSTLPSLRAQKGNVPGTSLRRSYSSRVSSTKSTPTPTRPTPPRGTVFFQDTGTLTGWDNFPQRPQRRGVLRLEFEGHEGYIDAGPGDFVHVPAWTVHRESNPTREPSFST